MSNASTKQVLFIDQALIDTDLLLKNIDPTIAVIWITAGVDGITQVATTLAGYTDLGAVHIVSHGSSGMVELGTSSLSLANLNSYQNELAAIGQALSADGDILLYGCDVGAGEAGAAFIQALAEVTGVDVTASDDLTGGSAAGGNWTLETSVGMVETDVFATTDALSAYEHLLVVAQDRFEDNDTAQTATDLRTISGEHTEQQLSVQANDLDWYRFTLGAAGRDGDLAAIDFVHTQGDLDLYLFDSTGATQLGVSNSVGNHEEISLAGRTAGSYLIAVAGYDGASNPNYSLTIAAAPVAAAGDRFEDNDTAQTATDLRTISGEHTEQQLSVQANDLDWYRFTLGAAGRDSDLAAIDFVHTQGDLDLYLFDSTGATQLGVSDSVANHEEISLAGRTAGSYLIAVAGYDGASNPNYSLTIAAAPVAAAGDRFEDNDTAPTATDLRTISGEHTEQQLSVQANDLDWYRFTLGAAGRDGDLAAIDFVHAQGDLDLYLFDSTGATQLGVSNSVANHEEISLAGRTAGSYLIAVAGYDGASNPNYSLTIAAAPVAAAGDRFEDNDTAQTATDLRTISGEHTEQQLNVQANDADWYRFILGAAGRDGDKVAIDFVHAQGDLDLYLYDSTGATQLGVSDSVGNQEEISLAGRAAGTYLARVVGYNGASNADYSLTVNVTPTTPNTTDSTYEPNNDFQHATVLRQSGSVEHLAIQPSGDVDWFAFSTDRTGGNGDTVSIDFAHSLGDLDLALYTLENGQAVQLRSSAGQGNSESIPLTGLASGNYYVKVFGYQGASNSSYDLTVNASIGSGVSSPSGNAEADRYEANNTASTATDLRTLDGHFSAEHLSLHNAQDQDWFVFRPAASGQVTVSLDFQHDRGDLDLKVFDASGTSLIGSSDSNQNHELVNFNAQAGVAYRIEAYGYSGATNPDYTLTIDTPQGNTLSPDQWESNDTAQLATQLRNINQTLSGATIHSATDQDWFSFHTAASGRPGDAVTIDYQGGPLQLSLYNASGQAINTQTGTAGSGQVSISMEGKAAGDYFAKIAGNSGASGSYSLNVRAPDQAPATTSPQNTWTVLVYMDADNNLEQHAFAGFPQYGIPAEINKLEMASLPNNVTVALEVDRIPGYVTSTPDWTDTRRGVVQHDNASNLITSNFQSIGERNMGNPQTLTEFLNWGTSNFPAQNYALVLWDHGGGLTGTEWDDSSQGDNLSFIELRSAITNSQVGQLDLMVFNNCLQGMVEQAYDLSGVVDCMVASEDSIQGYSINHQDWLTALGRQPSMSALQLGSVIVDDFGMWGRQIIGQTATMSAVDVSKMGSVRNSINSFVNAVLTQANTNDWSAINQAMANARHGEYNPQATTSYAVLYGTYVDLGGFMGNLAQSSANAQIRQAASAVSQSVDAAVIRETSVAGASGLTIYFPTLGQLQFLLQSQQVPEAEYLSASFRFAADTLWDDFLARYVQVAGGGGFTAGSMSFDYAEQLDQSGQSTQGNNHQSESFDLGTQAGPNQIYSGFNIDSADDVDWYRFNLQQTGPQGANLQAFFQHAQGDLKIGLYDDQQQLVLPEADSKDDNEIVTLAGLQASREYYLKVEGVAGSINPAYSIVVNATGGLAPPQVPADFAEDQGGNNSLNKPWMLGTASQLTLLGSIANLTFDSTDLASGSLGGDWFKVQGVRLTALNANRVAISGVGSQQGDLDLHVYNSSGALIGESLTGQNIESVTLAPLVEDILIQVTSRTGQTNAGYSLAVMNGNTTNGNIINGTPGNDTLTGGAGNDTYDGGAGLDTAIYTAVRSSYAITKTSTGFTVSGGADGTDTLTHMERLQFPDINVALDIIGNAGQVYRLYQAAFDRQPDTAGLGYWINQRDHGATLEQIAGGFINSTEFSNLYGANPTNEQFVTNLYNNVLHRPFDQAGFDYWVNELAGGASTRNQVLAGFSESAENQANVIGLIWNGFEYTPPINQITGTPDNDRLPGTSGNDNFDGDAGLDTVIYPSVRSSHAITKTSTGFTVSGGTDGTDTLAHIERLQFSDGNVALDINGNAGQVYRLYQAAFDRQPDTEGLGYWIKQMDHGATLEQVASGFIKSAEFSNLYGANPTTEQFVTNLYNNVLNRIPDQAGFDYWGNALAGGGSTPDQVLVGFSESAENQANVIGIIGNGIEYIQWL